MKLSELTPKAVDFEVHALQLTFRPLTIGDDLKSQEICGEKMSLGKIFENLGSKKITEVIHAFEKISLVAWYQLTVESQRLIVQLKDFIFIDPETEEEKSVKLKPIEKFRNLFSSPENQQKLFTAYLRCRGLNIPDLNDKEALKKWNDQLTSLLPSIGR